MSSVWILTLLPLRSRFSWARLERMSFALLRASIRWSSDRSGAALEDWTGACTGRQYIRGRVKRKEVFAVYEKNPRLSGEPRQLGAQLRRDPRARGGVAEALSADGNDRCTRTHHFRGLSAGGDAPHRDHRYRDSRRDGAHLGERNRPDGRSREPTGASAEPPLPRTGVDRRRAQ